MLNVTSGGFGFFISKILKVDLKWKIVFSSDFVYFTSEIEVHSIRRLLVMGVAPRCMLLFPNCFYIPLVFKEYQEAANNKKVTNELG